MNVKRLFIILLCILVLIVVFVGGFVLTKTKSNTAIQVPEIDENYNKEIRDSIEYNIIKKDSIIKVIDYEFERRVQEVNELDDSSAVKLFYELVESE